MDGNGKCPVMHGANTKNKGEGTTNRDWWPSQIDISILHQHDEKSNPMEKDFNYYLFDSHLIFPNEEVSISSVRLKVHPVDKIYNSFLKGGLFLNNLNPSLNLYYNTLRLIRKNNWQMNLKEY